MQPTGNRMTNPPTLVEFKKTARDALGYLGSEFAFREVEPPAQQVEVNPFILWFVNPTTLLQVQGINWGFAAQVIVGPADARSDWSATMPLWPIIKLRRPDLYDKAAQSPGQLGDLRYYAHALREIASDVLRGDFGVFPSARAVLEAEASQLRSRDQEEARHRNHATAVAAAAFAFRSGDFGRVVELLGPHAELLTPAEHAKLEYARAHARSS
jgi:hypothetical protein